MKALALPRWDHIADALREVAQARGMNKSLEVFAGEPRDMFDILMPNSKRVNVVVVEPPGTPLHGLSPFAVLPYIRKELLEAEGLVVPPFACLEAGVVESFDLAGMFSVPGGHWGKVDLTVWNEEAREKGVLRRLVPYAKWFGLHSTMKYRWLSAPQCIFNVDLNVYARRPAIPEEIVIQNLQIKEEGHVHAVVARWSVWSDGMMQGLRLGAESDYLGRDLTWPYYVQAIAAPNTGQGFLEPVQAKMGETLQLEVTVKQEAAKVTGSAGPEFTFRLLGADAGDGSSYAGQASGDVRAGPAGFREEL